MFLFSDHKNRVFRRKALTISTHRTSFSRFWRSIFLQLLVINRFIDEYAIRMYACFTRMIYIATYCPTASRAEKEKKGRKKNALFFYLRDCTRRTRSRKLNPEIQSRRTRRKGYTHHFARAHDIDYYYYYVHAVVFATRGFEYPDLTDEIFQNHSLHASTTTLPLRAFTRTYTYTHTHALLDVEVRCLIYYTLS